MKEYKIITLGGAGINICRTLLSQGVDSERISHFNTDLQAVKFLNIKNKFFVGEEGLGRYNYEVTKWLFDTHVDLFEQAIEADILYVLVCGLGGGTGAGLVINLSELLIRKNRQFIVIATLPLKFEGEKRMSRALGTFTELESLASENFIPLPIDTLVTPDVPITEIFRRADQCVAGVIKGILMKCEANHDTV